MRSQTPVKLEKSFKIKKCIGSRKGWKIIPDGDDDDDQLDTNALRTVVSMIKEMECQVSMDGPKCNIFT